MDWRKWLNGGGLPGWILKGYVITLIFYWIPYFVNSASGHMDNVTKAVLNPLTSMQSWALNPQSSWVAPPMFLATAVFFVYVCPLITFSWFILYIKKKRSHEQASETHKPAYRNLEYEQQLSKLVQAVNRLPPNSSVPMNVRRHLVKVMRLFEARLIDILGIHARQDCRMMWIVNQEEKDQEGHVKPPAIWARKQDAALTENEEKVFWTCLSPSWFSAVDHIKTNPLFQDFIPERMETIVCARNMDKLKVSFLLSIDKPYTLDSETTKALLLAHMSSLMILWDMDIMRRVMVELEEKDWKEVDAL